MKNGQNYIAWKIKEADFEFCASLSEKIKFILQYGILAPSCHNTQPWFFVVKDNLLSIYIDNKRQLPMADPFGRGLFISAGACLENILIAARHFNLGVEFKIIFDFAKNEMSPIIEVMFDENQGQLREKNYEDSFFPFMVSHRMNRLNYQKNYELPKEFFDFCFEVTKKIGCSLFIESSDKKVSEVAGIVAEATRTAFNKKVLEKNLKSGYAIIILKKAMACRCTPMAFRDYFLYFFLYWLLI